MNSIRSMTMASILLAVVFVLAGCGGQGVPDVVGFSYDSAREQLEEQGFRVERRDVVDEDVEKGEVTSQDPAPGEPLPEDQERVVLTVAAPFEATIEGSMTLKDGFSGDPGESCSGSGGYDDIRGGAQVTVSNESGDVLAVGRLGAGEGVPASSATGSDFLYCKFEFEVTGVPRAEIYTIEVSHRGGLSYSFEEMESQGWTVEFSLG